MREVQYLIWQAKEHGVMVLGLLREEVGGVIQPVRDPETGECVKNPLRQKIYLAKCPAL